VRGLELFKYGAHQARLRWISRSATVRIPFGRVCAYPQARAYLRQRGRANARGTVAVRQLSTVDNRTALAPLAPVVVALTVGSLARWFESLGRG
jgi:hypothetical protein